MWASAISKVIKSLPLSTGSTSFLTNETEDSLPTQRNDPENSPPQTPVEIVVEGGAGNAEAPSSNVNVKTGNGEWQKYFPVYRALLKGEWKAADEIFKADEKAMSSGIAFTGETALHTAIGTGKASIDFVQQLVNQMPIDKLASRAALGYTPLHVAALAGDTKAAKILVKKDPDMVYLRADAGLLPLHLAAEYGHRETLDYLLKTTHHRHDNSVYTAQSGLKLLLHTIDAAFYDVALELAKEYPELALLREKDEGENGSKRCWLKSIQSWHYWFKNDKNNDDAGGDRRYSALERIADINSVLAIPRRFNFLEHFIYSVPGVKMILGPSKEKMYEDAVQLVECLCNNLLQPQEKDDVGAACKIYMDAINVAALSGAFEVIEVIVATFPLYIDIGINKQTIFHLAAENRCEKIFHLIFQTSSLVRHHFLKVLDDEENNILHCTAKLAPPRKLNLVSGSALQMQRELQWYKAVEKLITPESREKKNKAKKTPEALFTEEHKALKLEGEKWMKDTGNSCFFVAALIATVVFAAAFTVPGGNKEDSGRPFFFGESSFIIFAVSDAVSLFTAINSLLMFLGILTSRFAEKDFLHVLPRRLTIGLLTLFVSILSMMVAFGATLYIIFGQEKSWIFIPVVALGSLPVTLFALLHFPLLVDLISNTYGSGNILKQIKRKRG